MNMMIVANSLFVRRAVKVRYYKCALSTMLMLGLFSCLLSGCGPKIKAQLIDGALAMCPDRPNCVCSQCTADPSHGMSPLVVDENFSLVKLKAIVAVLERTVLLEETATYLHYTFASKWFGFKDDVEFLWLPQDRLLHFRSAARLGYRDFGVNRERMVMIQEKIKELNHK